jgi:hypothetical protein
MIPGWEVRTFQKFLPDDTRMHAKGRQISMLRIVDSYLEIEVLTAAVMKSTTFWDITACTPLKVNRRSRGTYASIFMVEERESRYHAELSARFHAGFLLGLFDV